MNIKIHFYVVPRYNSTFCKGKHKYNNKYYHFYL